MGDRRHKRLLELGGLLDGLLEMDAGLRQAAELGEEGAEVDVDSRLTELVGGTAQHLEGRLVGGERGIELALLVEDHPALEVGVSERGTAHRRLGDVEDRQRVGQLTLIRDDQRQRGGDAAGQGQVVQAGGRLPGSLEVDARGAQVAELTAGHAEGPTGDRPRPVVLGDTEHRQRTLEDATGIPLHGTDERFGLLDPSGHQWGAYVPAPGLTPAAIMQP